MKKANPIPTHNIYDNNASNVNKLANYSFAQNEISHESPSDSFGKTKNELKQIMENHVAEEN